MQRPDPRSESLEAHQTRWMQSDVNRRKEPDAELDLRKIRKDVQEGERRKLHRIDDDRPDERLEVRLRLEQIDERKRAVPTLTKGGIADHQAEGAGSELAAGQREVA